MSEKEQDQKTALEEVTQKFSDLALSTPPADQLKWKRTAEVLTHEKLHRFLILAYCERCDYSEYMVRDYWKKGAVLGEQILKTFHYNQHPHKVEIAFVAVPDNSPFLDVPICSSCGREHTYRQGQGKTTPCQAFRQKKVDKTFRWFNMVMGVLGYSSKLKASGELPGLKELPELPAPKPQRRGLLRAFSE